MFDREPLRSAGGIPVFIEGDEYVANYERIASDHLVAAAESCHNPFIDEALWGQAEDSTAELIARHASAGSRILDVGVGLGRLLSRFPEFERHGIDISMDYLHRAKSVGIEVALARVEDLPYQTRASTSSWQPTCWNMFSISTTPWRRCCVC